MKHPYVVQPWRRPFRNIEFLFWVVGAIILLAARFAIWAWVVDFGIGCLWAWWFSEKQRCPQCRTKLESRVEMDQYDTDHVFFDCHECGITFDPEYATSSESIDSSSEE